MHSLTKWVTYKFGHFSTHLDYDVQAGDNYDKRQLLVRYFQVNIRRRVLQNRRDSIIVHQHFGILPWLDVEEWLTEVAWMRSFWGGFAASNIDAEVPAAAAVVVVAFLSGLCFKLLSYEKTSHRPGFSSPVCLAIVNCSRRLSTVSSVSWIWNSWYTWKRERDYNRTLFNRSKVEKDNLHWRLEVSTELL